MLQPPPRIRDPRLPAAGCLRSVAGQGSTHPGRDLRKPLAKSLNRQDGILWGNRRGSHPSSAFPANDSPRRPPPPAHQTIYTLALCSCTSEVARFGHAAVEASKRPTRTALFAVSSWLHSLLGTMCPSVPVDVAKHAVPLHASPSSPFPDSASQISYSPLLPLDLAIHPPSP